MKKLSVSSLELSCTLLSVRLQKHKSDYLVLCHYFSPCSANQVCLRAWEALGYLDVLLTSLLPLGSMVWLLLQPPWTPCSFLNIPVSLLILWSLLRAPAFDLCPLAFFFPVFPLTIAFSKMFSDLLFLRRNLFPKYVFPRCALALLPLQHLCCYSLICSFVWLPLLDSNSLVHRNCFSFL